MEVGASSVSCPGPLALLTLVPALRCRAWNSVLFMAQYTSLVAFLGYWRKTRRSRVRDKGRRCSRALHVPIGFPCRSGQRRCPRRTPAPGAGHVTGEERGAWDAVAFMGSGNEPALCLGGDVSSFLKVAGSPAPWDAPGEQSGPGRPEKPSRGVQGVGGRGGRLSQGSVSPGN